MRIAGQVTFTVAVAILLTLPRLAECSPLGGHLGENRELRVRPIAG
jgi:hypothetical protein